MSIQEMMEDLVRRGIIAQPYQNVKMRRPTRYIYVKTSTTYDSVINTVEAEGDANAKLERRTSGNKKNT
jgi:hypothetical protein